MRTLKLTLEYDGTNYVGWQRQAEGVSIQGLLEEALGPFEGGPLTVHGAGRTDAGVHALGQVASVRTRTEHGVATLQRALNSVLPVDVRIVAVEDANPDFHARFDAVSKTYEYRIANVPFVSAFQHRYVWQVPGALNIEAMRHGAQSLLGRHDFAAFQSTGGEVHTTERTILSISVGRAGEFILDSGIGDQGSGETLEPMFRSSPDPRSLISDPGFPTWLARRPGPAGHPRDRQRLPAAHGPHDRRHARRRWAGPLAGESGQRDSRRARSLAGGTCRAGVGPLSRARRLRSVSHEPCFAL